MRIGIVPVLSGLGGGLYQHSLNMLRALNELPSERGEDEFALFIPDPEARHPIITSLEMNGWTVKSLATPSLTLKRQALNMLRRIVGERLPRQVWRWLRWRLQQRKLLEPEAVRSNQEVSQWFRRCQIDLMLYTAPTSLSFEAGIPYVTFIMDLQHRLQPHFPEVSANGEWESREYLFRNAIRYATLLIVDSEVGKEDVLFFYGSYGATPDRIKVLPYLPTYYLSTKVADAEKHRVREKYKLPERYLFYPAQFWPHKNHAGIIQGLEHLERTHGLEIPIVFCGSYTGKVREDHFQLVMNMAQRGGIANQIHYLGYVLDEDMSGLYAGATALVMPTFFGPANIPPLEAWAFGCPVLTSDIRGIREQMGDAAILVDPRSVEAMAEGIYRLWTDEKLRRTLTERGQQRLATFTIGNYRQRLAEILEEAKARVCSEKPRSAVGLNRQEEM